MMSTNNVSESDIKRQTCIWMFNLFTIFIGEKSGLCLNILADSILVWIKCVLRLVQ